MRSQIDGLTLHYTFQSSAVFWTLNHSLSKPCQSQRLMRWHQPWGVSPSTNRNNASVTSLSTNSSIASVASPSNDRNINSIVHTSSESSSVLSLVSSYDEQMCLLKLENVRLTYCNTKLHESTTRQRKHGGRGKNATCRAERSFAQTDN